MKIKALTLIFMLVLVVGTFGMIPNVPQSEPEALLSPEEQFDTSNLFSDVPSDLQPALKNLLEESGLEFPEDQDIGLMLGDRLNEYKINYEPWKSKAAIHAIAYDETTGFLALGGGYLYDNEVHVFRLNTETKLFDKVWELGDSVFQSDVMALDIGDTDLNDFLEIAAGCADGKVYVFEQRHIYDPIANTENQFDHVWTSPDMFRVFDLKIDDVDRDYRPDIVVAAWDSNVHLFEYENHSGYPFVEEHWITYNEVATLPVGEGELIYSIETGDTNYNGLPEIICGTREGRVYVFENDGITFMINGQPFPLIYDNHYYLNWTSENYTWTPIISMDVGELDDTPGDEIALVAQGQGVMILEWNKYRHTYDYKKVYRDFKPWETFGFWQLDFYVDRMIYANNVTYFDPFNGSIIVDEPIEYVWNEVAEIFEPDASVYPYNSGMAGPTYLPGGGMDANYSRMDASLGNPNATAILDFGQDEEGTGGANAYDDLIIFFKPGSDLTHIQYDFNFSISQDGTAWEQISFERFNVLSTVIGVDVDDALSRRKWDYFRYVKIVVFNAAVYDINGIQLQQVYNTLTDALSVEIGPLRLDGETYLAGGSEPNKILVGSVTGEINAIMWNVTSYDYDLVWDSGDDDFYTLGANIWDMVYVGNTPDVPTWSWQYGMQWFPDGGTTYNSWSFGTLNPWLFGSATFNYFMGTNEGEIRAFTVPDVVPIASEPVLDLTTQSYFNNINVEISGAGWDSVSVEAPLFMNGLEAANEYSIWPFIALGLFNPDESLEDIPLMGYASTPRRASVVFYYRSDEVSVFADSINLWEIDQTGELSEVINQARAEPKLDFADFDNDGDLDFTVSNGYVYLAKNLWYEEGSLNFTLVRGYYDDINAKETSKVWGQPEMVDIDSDGDLDLILSYANSMGSTCWINEGTSENPEWVEDKKIMSNPLPETNMKYQNFTDVRIVPNLGSYYDGYTLERWYEFWGWDTDFDWTLAGYREWNQRLAWATPKFDTTESYVMATYPRVVQLDFSLMSGAAAGLELYSNIGFHVHESWSNDFDLKDWTLSVTSGDIDGDGNEELIVGDYDNNVYAFEHLANNTYKRMFRSFDLNHTEVTDLSPYLYQELEGISGDFNRRLWDHATQLVANVDLDQDGYKEIIVAANLQVYVFEDLGLYGGDQLHFVYSFDLRDTAWTSRPGWDEVTEITAMAAGDDLDYNGELELAVAAGPYLFIYNVHAGTFDGMNETEFFVTEPGMEGRYYLIGNPEFSEFSYSYINTITMCDTDQDGYKEVIIGGTEDTRFTRPNGFLYIYECQGGTFYKAWEAPEEVTYWNPISVVKLDDQDYDGAQELVIGHTNGFDLWEWIPGTDSQYQKVEYVTASPNYPVVPLNSAMWQTPPPADALDSATTERSIKAMAKGNSPYEDYSFMVYENSSQIWIKTYWEPNNLWSYGSYLLSASTGMSYTGNSSPIVREIRPDIASMADGDLAFTWEVYDSGGNHYIAVCYLDTSSGWYGPVLLPDFVDILTSTRRYYPSVFEYSPTQVGIVYTYDYYFFTTGTTYGIVGMTYRLKDLSGGWSYYYPDFNDKSYFKAHDVDVIRMTDDDEDGQYQYAIAMSAVYTRSAKADNDVWVIVSSDDANFNFTGSNPHQATTKFDDEVFVEIAELESSEHSLVIAYESLGTPLEDRFGMVASTTKGRTWSYQENLNTIPEYIERIELPGGIVYYQLVGGTPLGLWGPLQLSIFSPAVIPTDNAGFMYAGTFSFTIYVPAGLFGDNALWFTFHDIVYGINPQSDWTMNHLRNVVDLDMGDTDSDGRREVIVGFEDQVGVYEMKNSQNGTDFMTHKEVWLSNPFENPVTGVSVSDFNGNGWDEMGITTEHGDTYIWEYIDPSEGAVELKNSKQLWTVPTAGDLTWTTTHDDMVSYDFDNDGYDEIIGIHPNSNYLFALDDDGSTRWNYTDASDGFNYLLLSDLDNDTIPEVIAAGNDTIVYVLDIMDGSEIWKYGLSTYAWHLTTGDVTGDDVPEVIATDLDGDIWVIDANGNMLQNYNFAPGPIYYPLVGNFTDVPTTQVAFLNQTGEIFVVDPLNGSVYYQSPAFTASITSNMLAYDFNEDGFDDIAFTWLNVHVLDVNRSTIFFNSSYIGIMNELALGDFDGDNVVEILAQTYYSGLYLVEVAGGVTQWHYDLTHTWADGYLVTIWDMDVGNAGGSGLYDVVVAGGLYDAGGSLDISFTMAIDGKNGVPMWFNYSYGIYTEVVAALLPGYEFDSVVAWDYVNERITATQAVTPVVLPTPPAYVNHELYWEMDYAGVYQVWSHDFTGDGLSELLVASRDADFVYHLTMVSGIDMTVRWDKTFSNKISDLEIGYLNDWIQEDIAIWTGTDAVYIIDAADGEVLNEIKAPANYEFRGLEVADYDTTAGTFEEIAILNRQYSGGTSIFVEWFDGAGNVLYKTSDGFTSSTASWYFTTGELTGDGVPDVAFGASSVQARIYRGDTGGYYSSIGPSSTYRLLTANMLGGTTDYLIIMDSGSDVYLLDTIGGSGPTLAFPTGAVREIKVGNVDGVAGDEVVINVEQDGVLAYNSIGSEVWRYNAPLVLGGKDTRIICADMNGDGLSDVVLTNNEYINVIEGGTARLLWHYWKSDLSSNFDPVAGNFYDTGNKDVLCYGSDMIYVVAHSLVVPPIPAALVFAGSTALIESVIYATLIGVPILFIALVIPARIYQKREEK